MASVGNYDISRVLGRGSFGVTYLGTEKGTGRQVAIKTIDINKSIKSGANLSKIQDEIDSIERLSKGEGKRYVSEYYDSFQGMFNGVDTIFIISEFIDGE